MFIEVGAVTRTGSEFPSKAAIKRAIATDPSSVMFCWVGGMGEGWSGTAAEFPDYGTKTGNKLTLVGPNPYSNRKYYGTVTVKAGKVAIS